MALKFLNLGCGNRVLKSDGERVFVNHDIVKHRPEIDVVHDLSCLPWPWADVEFDHILAWAVLEHLEPDLIKTANEMWRILKPGGQADVKLPYWNSEQAHDDPTHRWFCTLKTYDQLDPTTERGKCYAFYSPFKWRIVSRKLNKMASSLNIKMVKIV